MLALEGMKVIDLTRTNPGAICTMILGDFSAEVVKLEAPAKWSVSQIAIWQNIIIPS